MILVAKGKDKKRAENSSNRVKKNIYISFSSAFVNLLANMS
jgi:hypothetical protein